MIKISAIGSLLCLLLLMKSSVSNAQSGIEKQYFRPVYVWLYVLWCRPYVSGCNGQSTFSRFVRS